MKNKKLVKKLVPENPPKTGNFGTQQAFLIKPGKDDGNDIEPAGKLAMLKKL